MLNAHTHSKCFAFKRDAHSVKQGKYISCRVSTGKNYMMSTDELFFHKASFGVVCFECNANDFSMLNRDVSHAATAFYGAAFSFNLFADAVDNMRKNIATNVRMCIPENIFTRAMCGKCFQYQLMPRTFCSGGKLAVRKSARTAHAKLNVALRIERSCSIKIIHRLRASISSISAFNEQRFKACMS